MSDANRARISYEKETSFGTLPGTVALKEIRYTGESLRVEQNAISSQEIRSDRQIVDLIRNGVSANGDVNIELSYGAYDDFLEYALQSATWTATVTNSGTYTNASGNITGTGVGTGLALGDWVRVKDGSTIIGYAKITTYTGANDITITPALTDFTGGGNEEVEKAELIYNGTTLSTLGIEREYQDLSSEFVLYSGMSINTFALNLQPDQIITGSFGFIGKNGASASATADTAGGVDAAAANSIVNAIDHVDAILEGQDASMASIALTQFGFELNNNLRARLQIGTLGAISLGVGSVGVTGTLQGYYNSKTLIDKFLNNTTTGLSLVIKDASDNAYVIEFPSVKLSTGQRPSNAINTDVINDLSFTAFRDAAETNPNTDVSGVTMKIGRWAA